jgi:hypothetical protein
MFTLKKFYCGRKTEIYWSKVNNKSILRTSLHKIYCNYIDWNMWGITSSCQNVFLWHNLFRIRSQLLYVDFWLKEKFVIHIGLKISHVVCKSEVFYRFFFWKHGHSIQDVIYTCCRISMEYWLGLKKWLVQFSVHCLIVIIQEPSPRLYKVDISSHSYI